jgi:hypothetical protein
MRLSCGKLWRPLGGGRPHDGLQRPKTGAGFPSTLWPDTAEGRGSQSRGCHGRGPGHRTACGRAVEYQMHRGSLHWCVRTATPSTSAMTGSRCTEGKEINLLSLHFDARAHSAMTAQQVLHLQSQPLRPLAPVAPARSSRQGRRSRQPGQRRTRSPHHHHHHCRLVANLSG